MPSKIMSISIPESMHRHVRERVSEADYGSVSEYFRELIRRDQRLTKQARQQAVDERQQPLASAARRTVGSYTGRRY